MAALPASTCWPGRTSASCRPSPSRAFFLVAVSPASPSGADCVFSAAASSGVACSRHALVFHLVRGLGLFGLRLARTIGEARLALDRSRASVPGMSVELEFDATCASLPAPVFRPACSLLCRMCGRRQSLARRLAEADLLLLARLLYRWRIGKRGRGAASRSLGGSPCRGSRLCAAVPVAAVAVDPAAPAWFVAASVVASPA